MAMGIKRMKKLIILAMSPVGNGLSGGDRIFIELARNANIMHLDTRVVTWEDGIDMCQRGDLKLGRDTKFVPLLLKKWKTKSFFLNYLARIIKATVWSLNYSLPERGRNTILYVASDFLMDALPGFILWMRFPKLVLANTFYLAAPNPFQGYKEHGEGKMPTLRGLLYWISQQPIYQIIRRSADFVFVTSTPDIKRFPQQAQERRVIVIQGGVDLDKVKAFQKKIGRVNKEYDAVFQGRFHPQKGVLELIDIWSAVVKRKPTAKLILIGDGPLMLKVKQKIEDLKLQKNVILAGYVMDGIKKFTIFAKSKLVVHPAIYDSGGMAAAEAMAWNIPAVSFDLEALKTYYPKGMLKVPLHNNQKFALMVMELLTDKQLYQKTQKAAAELIQEEWGWRKRASFAIRKLISYE